MRNLAQTVVVLFYSGSSTPGLVALARFNDSTVAAPFTCNVLDVDEEESRAMLMTLGVVRTPQLRLYRSGQLKRSYVGVDEKKMREILLEAKNG